MELAWKGFAFLHSVKLNIFKFPTSQQPLDDRNQRINPPYPSSLLFSSLY